MRTHLSLNVQNVPRSVEFYKKVFGVEPQKQTESYAKFDLKNPALNFSMQSGGSVSRVSHWGIEVESAEEVQRWEQHFREQGLLEYTEKDVECCYARQDKAWVKDPDGNALEVFFVSEQLPIEENKSQEKSCCAPTCCA